MLILQTRQFIWSISCEEAFIKLKEALTIAPILAYPQHTEQFILDTDSSGWAAGAALSQVQDGSEKVIGYFSKALTKTKQEYCVTRNELPAVVLALENFHQYVYGREVILRTDNAAVLWMKSLRAPTGQTARWLEHIQTYHRVEEARSTEDQASFQDNHLQDHLPTEPETGEAGHVVSGNPQNMQSASRDDTSSPAI